MSPSTTVASASLIRRLAVSLGALMVAVTGLAVVEVGPSTPARATPPWDQLGLDIDGEAAGDQSGHAVAFSADGSRLAVGAIRNSAMGTNAGQARVYEWSGSAWVQLGADIDAEASASEFGYAVALSADGTRLAVGARLNSGAASLAGHVRVYDWSGSAWVQLGADIDGAAQYEQTGFSVALSDSGGRVAIGGVGSSSNRGVARVYDWSGSAWTQVGADVNGDATGDIAGWSVDLSADGATLAVGAPANDAAGSNAGRVSVYSYSGTAWVPLASVDGEAADDFAGRAVALSADGTRLAVGAPKNDGVGLDAGHVRVYSWFAPGSAWVQLGADIDGQAANDQAGASVALSADGSRVAVGSIGAGPGAVRVFQWSGSTWVQIGIDVAGEADGDFFGFSVALSDDGGALAVGATRNDGTGTSAGHVRVHGTVTPTPVPGPPYDVTAVAGDTQALVSWTAPLDNGGFAITGYTVTATPGGETCTTTGALSCTVVGLTNGTASTFTVTATNGVGTGPPSNSSGWVTPATLPGAPTGVIGIRGETEVAVVWTAPASDGGSTITDYTVTASPGGATCTTTGTPTCTVTGLTNGTSYTFTAVATNAIGTGPTSAASSPIIPSVEPATVPGPPSGVSAVGDDQAALVWWSAPLSDGGSPISEFTVTASPGGQTCTTTGALTCTVSGLTNGTAYTFRTTATNAIGVGPASTASTAVTPSAGGGSGGTTGGPSGVTATPGDGSATVSWNPPSGDGNVTGYTVTTSPGGASCSTTGALTCTITGLANGTTYSFTVTVSLDGSLGPSSSSAPVTPTTTTSGSAGGAATVTQSPLATMPPCPAPVMPFTDVETVISKADVACIYGLDITTGTSWTTYSPERLVDRDQMASFLARLWRAAGLECPSPSLRFLDVANVISQDDVACIYGLGITTGTSWTTYSPERLVDRDQMASFLARLWRAAGLECPSPSLRFVDVANVISQDDVACIYGLGITTGTSWTTYSPERLVDRDQMASFLARLWRALRDAA